MSPARARTGAPDASAAEEPALHPELDRRLRAAALDVLYHRASGDRLWFRGADGEEREVLDLVGGFGACLFGHNHPALVAVIRSSLEAQRPFHAQASTRGPAARLAARLAERVRRTTGGDYRAAIVNTGTEAVEAAIKHAELERARRVEARVVAFRRKASDLRARFKDGNVSLPADIGDGLLPERVPGAAGLDRLLDAVELSIAEIGERSPTFLAIEGAFHGKTTGSLQLTWADEYRHPWRRLGVNAVFLPHGDVGALERAVELSRVPHRDLQLDDAGRLHAVTRSFVNVAACFAEPIQGEGGIRELPPEFLRALRRAADAHGFPLVLDEIQSGMGRTGTFLASEASGVRGDYYLLSKALGGGLCKIAALLVDRRRYRSELGVLHTSTFAEDDVSALVALRALELLDEDDGALLARTRAAGEHLLRRLRDLRARHPGRIADVRGRGLMIGVELAPQRDTPSPLLRVLSDQGLLGLTITGYLLHEHGIRVVPSLSSRSTLRVEPSAYAPLEELDRFCDALESAMVALRDGDALTLTRHLGEGPRASLADPSPAPAHRGARRTSPPEPQPIGPHVAFLSNFMEPGDLRGWDPRLAALDDDACDRFLSRASGVLEPFVLERTRLRSIRGEVVDATIVGIPFLPHQVMRAIRAGNREWALELVRKGIEAARAVRCTVVGLGGYTSIVSHGCRAFVEDELALTSGNALAAAAALEGLFLASRRIGLGPLRLGVLGALGNIGSVLAEAAAERVVELVLVGRDGTREDLDRLARSLADRTRVRTSTDLAALRDCNAILCATNSPSPVLHAEHVTCEPAVVSDVAVPRDVDASVMRERPNAVVLKGGLVRAPLGQDLGISALRLEHGTLYGCLAETLILGLAGVREHFSYGRLRVERVSEIRHLARSHGFEFDENPYRW